MEQFESRWNGFLALPMADKRHRANQAREALGRQIIPWTFGLPRTADTGTHGQFPTTRERIQSNKRRQRTQRNVDKEARSSGLSPNPTDTHMEPEISWDEFFQGHALPHSKLKLDPSNKQRTIRWSSADIPEWRETDGSFPQMRCNIMELVSRYQQDAWWQYGIYTESVLTTLIITRKFGQPYPQFDISHQYGITAWYELLMYCVYGNKHWSLLCIFVTDM